MITTQTVTVENLTNTPIRISFIQITADGDHVKVKLETDNEHWMLFNNTSRKTLWTNPNPIELPQL